MAPPGRRAVLLGLVVVLSTTAAVAAKAATATIPIVVAVPADLLGARLIASLARPGGNVTGLTTGSGDIVPKRVELLKTITGGKAVRIGMVYNPDDPSNVLALASAHRRAATYVTGS